MLFRSSIIGLVAFYSSVLPDFYLVSRGDKLMVSSLFSISARPCESKVTVAVSDGASTYYLWNKKMEYSLSDEFESRPLRQTTK